jgi:rhodanese-related sulfurtransferase
VARRTIHEVLDEARLRLRRLTAVEARAALDQGAVVVDTRTDEQRRRDGCIAGAHHLPLSELEWWLDPASEHALPGVGLDAWIVVVCQEGYASSLAAARLQSLGFSRATDLVGGIEGWKEAGLPLVPHPT